MGRASQVAALVAAALGVCAPAPAADPTVSNVRAQQLADRTIEVTYDLAGAPPGGATVSVAFSSDGGVTYPIVPAAALLRGDVGPGVASGTRRRIVWDAPSSVPGTLPAGFFSEAMKAAVTAVDPGAGPAELTITLPGGVPLVLLRIPAATFSMGSPDGERGRHGDEGPQHQVSVAAFYLGRTEVTQRQWAAVMGSVMPSSCGSYGLGDDHPVYCVSWNDICGGATGSSCAATSFIGRLSAHLGTTRLRLPTEAEWERAARAGATTRFSHGDALECTGDECEPCTLHDPFMWWCGNAGETTHPVASKQENPFGLHDMHGNVWEWVGDWYGQYGEPSQSDPQGPTSGTSRVLRGGSTGAGAGSCRSARRNADDPGVRYRDLGFRLASSL